MASSVSKIIPSDPGKVMVIGHVDLCILTCSLPFLHGGLFKIGGRATIIRMSPNALAVFSPVALTDAVKSRMQHQFGNTNVSYIVALDREHHIFLESWHKAWPEAKLLGPETLPTAREQQGYYVIPDENWILFRKEEQPHVDDIFDNEFEPNTSTATSTRNSCSATNQPAPSIEADLLFNLPATKQWSRSGESATSGIPSRLVVGPNQQHPGFGDVAQEGLIWWYTSSRDRKRYHQEVCGIVEWDFERILPCHGDVIESQGKDV
jgi:hypothetical protein